MHIKICDYTFIRLPMLNFIACDIAYNLFTTLSSFITNRVDLPRAHTHRMWCTRRDGLKTVKAKSHISNCLLIHKIHLEKFYGIRLSENGTNKFFDG